MLELCRPRLQALDSGSMSVACVSYRPCQIIGLFYSVAQTLELLKWGPHSRSHDLRWTVGLSFPRWTSGSVGGAVSG